MPIETDLNDLKETDSLKAKEKDNAINYKEELINANPNSVVKGNVEVIELMGAESYIYTRCGKDSLNVRVEGTTNLKIGEVAKLYLRSEKLHVFDKETEIRVV